MIGVPSARSAGTYETAVSTGRPSSRYRRDRITVLARAGAAFIALVFRCKITGGPLTTTNESAAFRWVTAAEVSELATEAYAVRVLDGLDGGSPPAIRQHDGIRVA